MARPLLGRLPCASHTWPRGRGSCQTREAGRSSGRGGGMVGRRGGLPRGCDCSRYPEAFAGPVLSSLCCRNRSAALARVVDEGVAHVLVNG